jgi:alanine dehydrogenase
MQLLDPDQVAARLPYPPLIQALRQAFQDGATVPLRHHHTVESGSGSPGTLLLMPAWTAGGPLVIKIVTVFPDNGERGLPAVMGTVMVLEGETGRPLALLDGGELTARRTAAASALAADLLAHPEATDLLVVGTGRMARELVRAHQVVRPLTRIGIWGRSPDRALALVDELRRAEASDVSGGLTPPLPSLRVVQDLQEAVQGADIVSCATLSSTPLVQGDWLKPGAHLDLVGAFTPRMRETDAGAVARSRIFVDTREGALKEGGDLLMAGLEGSFQPEDIVADLRELCLEPQRGRRTNDEITLFKSVGTALEDLAAARLVLARG